MPRGGYEADRNNFAPRVGFAWSLDELQRWVVRGGYGIYYNQGALATSEGLYFNPPYFNLSVYFPGTGPAAAHARTIRSRRNFPVFIPQSATAYQRICRRRGWSTGTSTCSTSLSRSRAIEVGYVGSRGHDLISARDLNQPAASPAVPNLRPNPLFADITLIESRASSEYNALQVKYRQQMDAGLSALVSYTYGKSTDDASGFFTSAGDPNFPQNSLDPGAEHGRSSFDVRHRLAVESRPTTCRSAGNVLARRLAAAGGAARARAAGRSRWRSIPDIDVSNTGRSNLGFGYNDRPNVTGDPTLSESDRTETQWFKTSAFSMPAFGTFGNSGRNTLEGPGYQQREPGGDQADPARRRAAAGALRGVQPVQHHQLDLPDAFLGSPTFGQVLSAGPPRRMQLGVRALF